MVMRAEKKSGAPFPSFFPGRPINLSTRQFFRLLSLASAFCAEISICYYCFVERLQKSIDDDDHDLPSCSKRDENETVSKNV